MKTTQEQGAMKTKGMMLWEVQGNRGQEHDGWVLSEMKGTPTVGGMGKQEGSAGSMGMDGTA